jgi:Oxidoreductase family, C-terminal alpha/beta domain
VLTAPGSRIPLGARVFSFTLSIVDELGYGVFRGIVVENEVTALVDFGGGATGTLVTCTWDIAGTDRFEILGDRGKTVVEDSKTAVVTRLVKPEPQLSAGMDMRDVLRLFTGQVDLSTLYAQETIEFPSPWGEQHADVLENSARNVIDKTPLIAPGSEGIIGVRLANAIHLSDWRGQEVPLDFDEDEYLDLLNERIRQEGRFPEQTMS